MWVLFHWERLEKMRNWNRAAVKQGWPFVTAVGLGEQREWRWGWSTGGCLRSEISSSVFDGNEFSSFIQCFCVRNWKVQWPNYFFIVLAWLQVTAISSWLKTIVVNYVAVEIAHALSLWFESVIFNENSHSAKTGSSEVCPTGFPIIPKQWDPGKKRKNEDLEENFSSLNSATQTLEDLVQVLSMHLQKERTLPSFLSEVL